MVQANRLQRWVEKLLIAKPMLANIREDKLYDEMEKNFDVHAAEAVFQHMAGYYQMHVPRNSPAGVWIRGECIESVPESFTKARP